MNTASVGTVQMWTQHPSRSGWGPCHPAQLTVRLMSGSLCLTPVLFLVSYSLVLIRYQVWSDIYFPLSSAASAFFLYRYSVPYISSRTVLHTQNWPEKWPKQLPLMENRHVQSIPPTAGVVHPVLPEVCANPRQSQQQHSHAEPNFQG